MSFWESCLASTYRTFAAGHPAGRSDVEWWIDSAVSRGLLNWGDLGPESLCTVVLICGPSSPIRARAARELQGRSIGQVQIGAAWIESQSPGLDQWLLAALMDKGDPGREALHFDALWFWFGSPLIRFLERLYFIDGVYDFSLRLVRRVYAGWQFGQEDFECELYRRCLAEIPRWWPTAPPPSPPRWFRLASPEEQAFLSASLNLTARQRVVLFSALYGQLDARGIACVLRVANLRWNPGQVARLLRQAWDTVFRNL